MNANDRIEWLHKKIADNAFPSVAHLTERFSISRRQAQRDVDYLKTVLGAPLVYSSRHRGYYYTEPFSLPFITEEEGEESFGDMFALMQGGSSRSAYQSAIQLRLPYSATLEIKDKMTVLALRSMIVKDEPHHRYRCEFPSVELFLGAVISSGADIKIIEPLWLRDRLLECAKRIMENNCPPEENQKGKDGNI